METIRSFEPVIGNEAKVLILGTMPGVKSLEISQYYGFGRNQFWKIMGDLFQFDKDLGYEERKSKLLDTAVALWDIIHSFKREGSLDKNIKDIEVNDIVGIIKHNPSITTIVLNGGMARDIYKKHFKDQLSEINAITLYSTSPANAIKYEKKLGQWTIIKEILLSSSKLLQSRDHSSNAPIIR